MNSVYPARFHEGYMDALASDDSTHLMLTFNGFRFSRWDGCNSTHTDACYEILFTESFNEGKTWTREFLMRRPNMKDSINRTRPVLAYDIETKETYLAYLLGTKIGLSIKEHGQPFSNEIIPSLNMNPVSMNLGITVDKTTGERYLHLLCKTKDGSLIYTRSKNKGKKWSKPYELARNADIRNPPAMTVDETMGKGNIYAQYSYKSEIRIVWSNDHGKTWQKYIKVDTDLNNCNAITMCGIDNFNRVFTWNTQIVHGKGFLKYLETGNTNLKSMEYPLSPMAKSYYADISCAYSIEKKYIITILTHNITDNKLLLTSGFINATSITE